MNIRGRVIINEWGSIIEKLKKSDISRPDPICINPICIPLGVRNEEKGIVNEWHSQNFNIDGKALWVGAGAYAQSAFDYLNEG